MKVIYMLAAVVLLDGCTTPATAKFSAVSSCQGDRWILLKEKHRHLRDRGTVGATRRRALQSSAVIDQDYLSKQSTEGGAFFGTLSNGRHFYFGQEFRCGTSGRLAKIEVRLGLNKDYIPDGASPELIWSILATNDDGSPGSTLGSGVLSQPPDGYPYQVMEINTQGQDVFLNQGKHYVIVLDGTPASNNDQLMMFTWLFHTFDADPNGERWFWKEYEYWSTDAFLNSTDFSYRTWMVEGTFALCNNIEVEATTPDCRYVVSEEDLIDLIDAGSVGDGLILQIEQTVEPFPLGETTVTLVTTDSNNQEATCNAIVTVVGPDPDKDGVFCSEDHCPDTEQNAPVDANGCSIEQHCPCDNDWKNHGKYVSCVTYKAEDFVASGIISEDAKDAIVAEAGQSSCGKKKTKKTKKTKTGKS